MNVQIPFRLLIPALLFLIPGVWAQPQNLPESIPLWPKGAPGSEARAQEPEKVDANDQGKCNVSNVHNPSITPFLPGAGVATGTAVLIAPGGGHRVLCPWHGGTVFEVQGSRGTR